MANGNEAAETGNSLMRSLLPGEPPLMELLLAAEPSRVQEPRRLLDDAAYCLQRRDF